jgi:hypothetical protein
VIRRVTRCESSAQVLPRVRAHGAVVEPCSVASSSHAVVERRRGGMKYLLSCDEFRCTSYYVKAV